jgi:hypothetical protein
MRDVSPAHDNIFREIFHYVSQFVRHPLKEIAHLPNWNWPRILIMQITLSVISGMGSALVMRDFSTWKLAQGIFVFPFVATIIGIIFASFFYYYFQVFEKRTVSFLKLVTMVFLANTVFYVFHIPSGYFAFSDILGMAFTSMLLTIGLTENFEMAKRRALRLIGVLFVLIFVIWAFEKMRDSRLVHSVDTGIIDQSL